MNAKIVKMSLRALIILMGITMLAQGVLAAADPYDGWGKYMGSGIAPVSYTHLRAHETV